MTVEPAGIARGSAHDAAVFVLLSLDQFALAVCPRCDTPLNSDTPEQGVYIPRASRFPAIDVTTGPVNESKRLNVKKYGPAMGIDL
jgi:hypothetical protein